MNEENVLPDQNEYEYAFNLLSESDKNQYIKIKERCNTKEFRYNRNLRMKSFSDLLDELRVFCERHDEDDWKRFLACGVCWFDGKDLGVNNNQLMILTGKSKSTINDNLSKFGYTTVPINMQNKHLICDKIPFFNKHVNEMRKWTYRRKKNKVYVSDFILNSLYATNSYSSNNPSEQFSTSSSSIQNRLEKEETDTFELNQNNSEFSEFDFYSELTNFDDFEDEKDFTSWDEFALMVDFS
ncbi:hypothetical protein TRFO_34982 [Tritrichomonas foetus]|uniref:Initiator binding domain-containing protein n=1 Tax=Tritrichomonas foetus TaxID=1144522 RepID=A0A1J4JM27_9EUKA|nr:hypothetical protein TRFO_34982 [Tritrichomonas foetus]|eukprot:OHS98611.1 hypothetical protein TRFO_34982 [Tritrichomonas foetus]